MKLKEFYKRIETKDFFKNFKKENPDNYLISMFCFLSKNEKEGDKISFNLYSPSKKKFFSTEYPFYEIKELEEKEINGEPISLEKIKVDIDDLWGKVEENSKEKPIKLICFLLGDGWSINVFYGNLTLKKIKMSTDGKIISIEEKNLKDSFLKSN